MTDRGNGYWEADFGIFDSCLISSDYYSGDIVLARTEGDIVVAFIPYGNDRDSEEVETWAAEYGYPVEWEEWEEGRDEI